MKPERAKGTRDFLPEDKIARDQLIQTLTTIFERYGFNPIDTPLIERFNILAAKFSGGEEILKETFKLTDQGGRSLGLRYDLTVPFARVIAMNPQLKMPFKRYQIGPSYRDGPIKLGRYREFYQCDVDIVGCATITADAEMLNIATDVFNTLNLKVVIKLNNMTLLQQILEQCGIPDKDILQAIISIDKLEKIGKANVKKELQAAGIPDHAITKALTYILAQGTNTQKITTLSKLGNLPALQTIKDTLALVPTATFVPSLARALSYYTGSIFEVFAAAGTITSSLAGGGRYDNMIGDFIGKGTYPATGISFGLDTIMDCLQHQGKKSVATLYVIPIACFAEAYTIAQQLRNAGINVDIDLNDRGISKNLDYANKLNIPYVLFVGKEELKNKKVKLRNMTTGKEQLLNVNDIKNKLA